MIVRALACVAALAAVLGCSSPSMPAPVAPSPKVGARVELTYLGVAGWQLTDGAHVLLVDPYFSRVDTKDENVVVSPDAAAIAQHAPLHADAIVVTHSHYDHLLDAPSIAKSASAMIVGTESTASYAHASGVPDAQIRVVRGGDALSVGPFHIRAIRALHSLTGQAYAEIPRGVTVPMKADEFGEGGTLQYLVRVEGRSILFIGTANFIESELAGLRPDIAIIATGLREKIPDYACRLMRALGNPPLVFTNHFDAHRAPLGPKQMQMSDDARAHLAHFADEVHACSPKTTVVVPTHFRTMTL